MFNKPASEQGHLIFKVRLNYGKSRGKLECFKIAKYFFYFLLNALA